MAKPGAVGAAGGIIGATAAGLESLVINCSNHGKVSTTSTFGGGIIGLLRVVSGNTNYKVSGCYNYGDISGAIQVGGIVGGSRDRIENSYTLSTAKINGSAAIDLILDGKATTYIGAIVGRLETSAAIRTAGGLCDADGNPITVKITAVLDTDGGTLPEGVTSPAEPKRQCSVSCPFPLKRVTDLFVGNSKWFRARAMTKQFLTWPLPNPPYSKVPLTPLSLWRDTLNK